MKKKERSKQLIVERYIQIWKTLNRVNLTVKKKWKKKEIKKRARQKVVLPSSKEPIGCISPPRKRIRCLAHNAKQ